MGVKNLDLASFLRREKPYSQNQCIKTKIELAWLALQSVRVIRYHLLQKHDHWVIGVYKPWNSISLRCAHLSIPTACRSHPNTSSLPHLTPHSKGQNWYSEGREPASPLRGNTFSSIPHCFWAATDVTSHTPWQRPELILRGLQTSLVSSWKKKEQQQVF